MKTIFGSYQFQIKKYAMRDAVRPSAMQRLSSVLFSISAFCTFFRG